MEFDYFISYASEDLERADELIAELEGRGARCFIDHRNIEPSSQRYREDLARGITSSERILVLLSPYSQASDEVVLEVQLAHDHGRRLTAVWLTSDFDYTNASLEMLLASGQRIEWSDAELIQVVEKLAATATISSLQARLYDYRSVSEQLRIDLGPVFSRIDSGELDEAMAEIHAITLSILQRLWRFYEVPGDPPASLRELLAGCRDSFDHESMLAGLRAIVQAVTDSNLKRATVDRVAKSVEHLMAVMSVMRAQRWGLEELSPEVRQSARFLGGLLIEAGWLQGPEYAPRPDVVYMLFERPTGDTKKSLEILLGANQHAVEAIEIESHGRILPTSDETLKSRFVVLPEGVNASDSPRPGVLTPVEFVLRFTGLKLLPDVPDAPNTQEAHALTNEVKTVVEGGETNVLVFGSPGTGKSVALRNLVLGGWQGAPQIRFFVDYSLADQGAVDNALDHQLASRFPEPVKSRVREIVTYLVRSGMAALVLDSVECAANPGSPQRTAQTFARLCRFLSRDSHVILAGRDAALRDSATVREFFMDEPALTDRLAQVLRSSGVDSMRLPRFAMVRARRRMSEAVTVRSPRDQLLSIAAGALWESQDEVAARSLATVLHVRNLGQVVDGALGLTRGEIISLAIGGTPVTAESRSLDLAMEAGQELLAMRELRELRAAVDYVRAVKLGIDLDRWNDVPVGETTRRFVRLLSVLLAGQIPTHSSPGLALVGPPSAVIALRHSGVPQIANRTVTVGEYRGFLEALPRLELEALSPDLPDEGKLQPMFERVPKDYYRDPRYSSNPAVGVGWWAADSYARWAGGRLPSSLEWEIAGRTWDGRIFPWGDTPRTSLINCADTVAGLQLVDYGMWRRAMRAGDIPPCSSRPADESSDNVSVHGQRELVGNVWEWTDTPVNSGRVIAGGSYDNPLRACVLSSRSVARQSTRSNALGFRIVES